jgi:2-polyprenyl-3-methyl-5-hydroxy-6-metoxy-1,4-benzoquinol methylase
MNNSITTERVAECPACGSAGTALYTELSDLVFGAPGKWSVKQCSLADCRLLWLDPRPTKDDIHRAYENYYTHAPSAQSEEESVSHLRRAYRQLRERYVLGRFGYDRSQSGLLPLLLSFLQPGGSDAFGVDAMFLPAPGGPARLLEIGCGDGTTLERMNTRGWTVTGVEFDPVCVERVRSRNLPCFLGDVREQSFAASDFDAIFTSHVIEHVYDPGGFLKECFRLLKPGGSLVSLTPNANGLGHRYYQQDWRGLEVPRHLQIFSPKNLAALAKASGFRDMTLRTSNRGVWYLYGTSSAMRSARKSGLQKINRIVHPFTLGGILRQMFGRALLLLNPNLGEEIVIIARK